MKKKLVEVISFDEFVQLLHSTTSPIYKTAFKLGFLCGLRVSEVIKLDQKDIDYSRGLLFIRQSKGAKDRYVPFPNKLSKELKKYVPIKLSIRSLQRTFKHCSKEAGILKDVKFHTLRHSSATYYLNKGMNIREVQQLLGHSRLDTTMIYTHVSPDNIKEKIDKIWE